MDGLTLPYTLRQLLGLKHKRFGYTMIYSMFSLGVPFKDEDICNGWNGQLPLARIKIVVPV